MRINPNEVREAKDSLTDSLLRLRDSLLAEQLRSAALGRSALDEAKAMKSASLRHMAKEIRMPWARGRLISRELSKASDNSKYGAWAPVLAFSLHSSRKLRKAWAGKKTADERALAAYKESKSKGIIEGSKKAANSEARKAEEGMKESGAEEAINGRAPSPFRRHSGSSRGTETAPRTTRRGRGSYTSTPRGSPSCHKAIGKASSP